MLVMDYRQFINRDLPLTERGCASKAMFVSQAEARVTARRGRAGGGQLNPYHCGLCGGWHVGHRRRRH